MLKHEAGRAAHFVEIARPGAGRAGEPADVPLPAEARRRTARPAGRDGSYLLRTTLPAGSARPRLWERYMQLVQVEEAFRSLKSDLALRPIHHQLEQRVEAHILVAFLGYCLTVTLRMNCCARRAGPDAAGGAGDAGHDPDGGRADPDDRRALLMMPRYTEPEAEQQMILEKLGLTLPPQPPPRITAGQVRPTRPPNQPAQDPAEV